MPSLTQRLGVLLTFTSFAGKVNVNEGDYDRRTALHIAASDGFLEIVQYLVEDRAADVNVQDRWGGTPLDGKTVVRLLIVLASFCDVFLTPFLLQMPSVTTTKMLPSTCNRRVPPLVPPPNTRSRCWMLVSDATVELLVLCVLYCWFSVRKIVLLIFCFIFQFQPARVI